MADPFEKRLRRAETLEKEWPFAADLLRFFKVVIAFQSEVFRQTPKDAPPPPQEPLSPILLPLLERLLALTREQGSEELANFAREVERWPDLEKKVLLASEWTGCDAEHTPRQFFPRALLQPYAERAAMTWPVRQDPPGEPVPGCPRCGSSPLVSVLREDKSAETVRRSLVCSRCFVEWEFPRVLCPNCKQENPAKLPRYSAQEIPWMRIEGCDSCRKFLKSVDLTLNWDAEPVVDELASTPLDVIAREHGYEKIASNLAGL